MLIFIIIVPIWITSITNDFEHKVLRADWALMWFILF